MGLLFDTLNIQDPALARELLDIYEQARAIWKEQAYRSFTAHGPVHLQQVERNLDALARPLQHLSPPLSPSEIFVLLAACYLHDIGMQLDHRDARENHAEYSYQLILNSFPVDPRPHTERLITLSIADRNARVAIAKVARAHWTQHALELDEEAYIRDTNERGRLRLLGLLLATADLLDMSPVRARYFRSVHRLYFLDSTGEVHQTMHHLVRGNRIVASEPTLPNELRFELEWHDCTNEVRELSNWQMFWLTAEWHRLDRALTRQSQGLIRWSTPWAHVTFNHPEGPIPRLSDGALRILRAGAAEQRRVDRDDFADACTAALSAHERILIRTPRDSGSDAEALADWCYAHARKLGAIQVARVDVRAVEPIDAASIIAQLMEQWGRHLPRTDSEEALRQLSDHVRDAQDGVLTILSVDQAEAGLLEPILAAVLEQPDGPEPPARLCVLLGPNVEHIRLPAGVVVRSLHLPEFAPADLSKYMKEQMGLEESQQEAILSTLVGLDRLDAPALVRSFLHQKHCVWKELDAGIGAAGFEGRGSRDHMGVS